MKRTDIDTNDTVRIAAAIRTLPKAEWPGGYDETGLSLLDAVYSVNANYETTTRKVIERYRDHRGGRAAVDTAEDLMGVIDRSGGPEAFAAEVVVNRQRTSTRNGVLKSEAVHELAGVLVAHGAATKGQIGKLSPEQLKDLEAAWRRVRGQGSGITWRYFLMLLGIDGVKPDRMIIRFIAETVGRTPTADEAVDLITAAAADVGLPATEVDHRIWASQSRAVRSRRR